MNELGLSTMSYGSKISELIGVDFASMPIVSDDIPFNVFDKVIIDEHENVEKLIVEPNTIVKKMVRYVLSKTNSDVAKSTDISVKILDYSIVVDLTYSKKRKSRELAEHLLELQSEFGLQVNVQFY